jgi:hypothetical protein
VAQAQSGVKAEVVQVEAPRTCEDLRRLKKGFPRRKRSQAKDGPPTSLPLRPMHEAMAVEVEKTQDVPSRINLYGNILRNMP